MQRTWSYLESIFLGSEDIRQSLPEDCTRFDYVDKTFKEMMEEMAKTPNVVKATNVDGLPEKLEGLMSMLTQCEKALAEYLDTKRLAFPRFYFSSSADLLDILSNGNKPIKVAKHLTKLFDSVAKLVMVQDENGKDTKVAHSMVAKDGEVGCICIESILTYCCQGGQIPKRLPLHRPSGDVAKQSDGLNEGDHQVRLESKCLAQNNHPIDSGIHLPRVLRPTSTHQGTSGYRTTLPRSKFYFYFYFYS